MRTKLVRQEKEEAQNYQIDKKKPMTMMLSRYHKRVQEAMAEDCGHYSVFLKLMLAEVRPQRIQQ